MSPERDGLRPFIDQWGRYAKPEVEPQPIRFAQYMAWTPEECNKLEMVDGRLLVGNSEAGTERMLAFLMRAFGLVHTLRLAPHSAWRPALAEIGVSTLTPEREWSVLPEPPAPSEGDPTIARRQAATRLALDAHRQTDALGDSGRWLIGPFAVCPSAEADTVLIPDWLHVAMDRKQLFQEYYFDGAPDWVLEAPWPAGLNFCREVKLPLYFEGDAQEVWVLDWRDRSVQVYASAAGKPTLAGRYGPGERIRSDLFPELLLEVDSVLGEERQTTARGGGFPSTGLRTSDDAPHRPENNGSRTAPEESSMSLGRRAQPPPEPQRLDIHRLSAWRPAEWHKLEIVAGQVYMGGSREELERALALLLANVGLTAAVKMAPPTQWQLALARV